MVGFDKKQFIALVETEGFQESGASVFIMSRFVGICLSLSTSVDKFVLTRKVFVRVSVLAT